MSLPLRFEPNRGQAADSSQYIAQAAAYSIHFSPNGAALQLSASDQEGLPITLEGANAAAHIEPARPLPGKSNYYLSSDQSAWLTGIPNYAELHYDQIYPGTNLIFYGNHGRLEYDFVVAPQGDPGTIAMRIPGSAKATITAQGDLQLNVGGKSIEFLKPVVYQASDQPSGRQAVDGSYRLVADSEGTLVKFALGEYDHTQALVIDPVLSFAEPTPGTETVRGIQLDASGNIYIAGENSSSPYGLQVTKLASDGSTVLYSTSVSTSFPTLVGFAVDSTGRAYVAAFANPGLPTTSSAYQSSVSSGSHAYLATLDVNGSVTYASYFAGSSTDYTEGLAADATGKAYIFGETCSTDFPVTLGPAPTGCYFPYVIKVDPSQSGSASLVYSETLGASDAYALEGALDSSNNLYVALQVNSGSSYSATSGAFQYAGIYAPYGTYIEKLDPSGTPGYTAYLGPGNPYDIAADGSGAVYVTGRLIYYYDFPTTPGAFDISYPGGFLSKLSPDGSTLVYSTFLAGPTGTLGNVVPTSLAIPPGCASNCTVYFGGWTTTKDMPLVNPLQNANLSSYSTGFFGQLNSTGSQLTYLTYLGGSNESTAYYCAENSTCSPYLATDASGNLYIAGYDYSSDFPYTSGQNSTNNYLAKISPNNASFALAVPSNVVFPYSQPVGVATLAPSQSNSYYYVNQIVTLRNMGSTPISLNGISFQGTEFTETDNCNSALPAGGVCQVQVQFDPTQSGPRSDTMTISSSAPNSPTLVQVSGTGIDTGVLQTSVSALNFGSVNVGSTASQTVTINNVGNTSLQLYSISIFGPYTETDNCPNLLFVGASCTVNITFSPVTAGYANAYLYLSTSGTYYISPSSIPLTGTGVGVGTSGLSVTPSSVVFPTTNVGATSTNIYYVQVQNTGTVPFTLIGFSITGDFSVYSTNCGSYESISPSSWCYLDVQFVPTASGTRSGALSITTSLSATPQTVSLSGTGAVGTQALVLNPSAVIWPDQPIGTLSSSYTGNQTISLYNVGSSPLKIYRVYDDSGDFHIVGDGCSGETVYPNIYYNYYYSSCNVTVEFAPTQLGARTGTLTFIDSASGSPQTVALSGKGTTRTQVAVLNPTAMSFADQVINTNSAQLLYIYNYGNVPITVSNVTSDNASEFAVSPGCSLPFTVRPGSYCYEYVTFTPSGTGARSAHISFTDDSSGSPHVALATGMGLSPTGALEVNPTSIPFGSQATMLSSSPVYVTVHNPGNSTVNISSISATLADYVISNNTCGTGISAGNTCSFYVAFDPTTTGPRNDTVTITSSNATSQGLTVTGTGVTATKALVVIAPSTMDWGNITLNSNQSRLIFLRNIGTAPINFSSIGGLSAPFSLGSYCGSTLAVNTSCQLYIYYNPTSTGPTTPQTLTITSDAAGSPQSVTVQGTGVTSNSGIFFLQNGLQFDQVPTGTTNAAGQQSTVLYNFSGNTIAIRTPTVGSGFTLGSSNCGTQLNSGSGCYIYVQESPTNTGLYSANLSVPGVAAMAPLTGYGVAPQSTVDLDQDGMIFPDEVIGNASGVQTIHVTNVGTSPVSFTASSLGSSKDFIFYSDSCGVSYTTSNPLQPNSTCAVQLQFQPGSSGTLMATLTINDSAGGHTVTLEGLGVAPASAAEVRPGGISFSDTTVGLSSAQQGINLYNTGNVQITFSADPQICTATGNPCTTSSDFAIGPNGGYCTMAYPVSAGSSCGEYVVFTPQSVGAKTAVLRLNDSAGPHYVQLSGNGITPTSSVVASRSQWNFPDTPLGASTTSDYIYVTNTGTTPVTFGSLVSSSPEFALSGNNCAGYTSSGLPPGTQCYATLTFAPTGSTGLHTATLSIPTSAGNLSVALQGNAITGTSTLIVEASILDFGQVPVGVHASQYLYLTNTGTLPITLGTPSVSPTGEVTISGCSGTLYTNSSCYMTVTMSPSQTGQRSATITFSDNASGSPHQITVNAVGTSNQVTLSQTNLDFGSIAVGAQSPNVYVYYNNYTSSTVTISSVTLGGTNPGDYNIYTKSCSGGISANPPSNSCYVVLNFKPTATSTRSATLTIVDSTGTNQVVNLTGTGLPSFPIFTVTPSRLVFDAQPLNTTSTNQVFTIRNTGTADLVFTAFNLQQPASDFAITSNGCQGTNIPANQYCYIYLTFTPSSTSPSSATLSLTDNDSKSPQVLNISGNGQNGADVAVKGDAKPPSIQPGGSTTFTVTATNNGPQPADNVVLTMNSPTNASVQSITPTGATCSGTTTITCSVASLDAGESFSVAIAATNTTPGTMTINAVVNTSSADPNTLNNDASIIGNAGIADLQVTPATAPLKPTSQPAFAMMVTNNGPGTDDNVQATFDLNQFGFVSATSTVGSGCSFNGSQVVCSLGSLVAKASATITIVVQPPAYGWSSIEAYAKGTQPDPVPTNNLAHVTPIPENYNTRLGSNVSVDTSDPQTGTVASVMFPMVTRPGVTALAAVTPGAAPSGYRVPRSNQTFNLTSSAQFAGNLGVSLHFAATSFWHPSEARLFHNENGVWVDRTLTTAPGLVSGVTPSLSQFAIFEPLNQAPTANAGGAMVVAATASGNTVQLDGSKSTDPENDALTYKWTGPFPEGNGTVTGANPKVTLPVGVSQVTLVVNDGEVDSSPVAQSVTVSDFAVVANNSVLSLNRGQGANVTLALSPKFGAYNSPVTLSCGSLPADLSCQFDETSSTPGANGSSVMLTIAAAQTATLSRHGSPRTLAAWLLAMGMPFGFVLVSGNRKRLLARLGVLAIVLLALYMAGCGGAGSMSQTQAPPPPPTSTTSTVTVTGTSGSVQHSITLTVTRN